MMCLNEVFQFSALLVASDTSYAAAFGDAGSDQLVMLLMDMFHYGFLMAQIDLESHLSAGSSVPALSAAIHARTAPAATSQEATTCPCADLVVISAS